MRIKIIKQAVLLLLMCAVAVVIVYKMFGDIYYGYPKAAIFFLVAIVTAIWAGIHGGE